MLGAAVSTRAPPGQQATWLKSCQQRAAVPAKQAPRPQPRPQHQTLLPRSAQQPTLRAKRMTTISASGGSAIASTTACSAGAAAICSSAAAGCAPAQVARGRLEGGSWIGCMPVELAGMPEPAGCPGTAAPAPGAGLGGEDRARPCTPCCSCSVPPHCCGTGTGTV